MKITKHAVVAIDYTLRDDAGSVIDSSEGRGPLSFVQGVGTVIPGLEAELEGKEVGQSLELTIPAERGYGRRDEELVADVPLDRFDDPAQATVGSYFQVAAPDGNTRIVKVVKVEGDQITVDGNHPLAGQNLNFAVNVISVRPATPEEIGDGLVRDPESQDE